MTTNKQDQTVKAFQKENWVIVDEWISANKTWMSRFKKQTQTWENVVINGQGKIKHISTNILKKHLKESN